MKDYILALDQGTTSSRALVFDRVGHIHAICQKEFTQYYPKPGWVEHNPREIWSSQAGVMAEAVALSGGEIAAIGIANQRETTIIWDATTGEPVYNAIVWQDRRTAEYCDELIKQGLTDLIRSKTGLIPDAYFSGSKIKWILDNVPSARERAEKGQLRFGTVDSWLVWNLTGGKVHVTDVTNASRTMLLNIHTLKWDKELLELFGIPESLLPKVHSCSEIYGYEQSSNVPIAGIAGDQQAALFGQMCIDPGAMKNTYGTGCFMLMNTGTKAVISSNNLLTTIAWKIGETVNYALEGSIFVAGAVVQWLRDGLKLIDNNAQSEELAVSVPDNAGVYFVPALTGLGAPYWDPYAQGAIYGITRGTTAAHITRAALESIAFQTMDIARAMGADAGVNVSELKVDGGASTNNFLMQFQADVLGTKVIRPTVTETTALGAAYLAGLAVGYWSSLDQVKSQWLSDRTFTPELPVAEVESLKKAWANAVEKTLTRK